MYTGLYMWLNDLWIVYIGSIGRNDYLYNFQPEKNHFSTEHLHHRWSEVDVSTLTRQLDRFTSLFHEWQKSDRSSSDLGNTSCLGVI